VVPRGVQWSFSLDWARDRQQRIVGLRQRERRGPDWLATKPGMPARSSRGSWHATKRRDCAP
jgi:hypothetical protein